MQPETYALVSGHDLGQSLDSPSVRSSRFTTSAGPAPNAATPAAYVRCGIRDGLPLLRRSIQCGERIGDDLLQALVQHLVRASGIAVDPADRGAGEDVVELVEKGLAPAPSTSSSKPSCGPRPPRCSPAPLIGTASSTSSGTRGTSRRPRPARSRTRPRPSRRSRAASRRRPWASLTRCPRNEVKARPRRLRT